MTTTNANGIATFPSSFGAVRYTHLELRVDKQETFESLQDAVTLYQRTRMHKAAQETFWVLGFGSVLNIATIFEVNRGMQAYVDLHMPTLFGGLLVAGCERFWLAHNHPSNDVQPSEDDVTTTIAVMKASNVMNMHFEDHLILAPNGQWFSLEKAGILKPDPKSPYVTSKRAAALKR